MTTLKVISRIKPLRQSVNGNPRYRIGFDDATTAITSSERAFTYEIGNPGLRVGDAVNVEFTPAGRISGMAAYVYTYECDAGHRWGAPDAGDVFLPCPECGSESGRII